MTHEHAKKIVFVFLVVTIVSSLSASTFLTDMGKVNLVFATKKRSSSGGGSGSRNDGGSSDSSPSSDKGGGGSTDNGGGGTDNSNGGGSGDTSNTTPPPATEGNTPSAPPAAEETTPPPATEGSTSPPPPAASNQQTTTCLDGSAPDASGTCPATPPGATQETTPPPEATLNKQTCPPLPIDANGRCPGIDARGGGLGLPPVPPSPPPTPPTPVEKPESIQARCVGEVYFNIHSNKCVSADIPKDDGNCVTGYEKSTSDSSLCEPVNFHCPAGTHAQGYGGCETNERGFFFDGQSCTPGWHVVNGRSCEPDKATTQPGNTGDIIGTNIPAGQGGHILINPNGDGTCPAGSHKFGAVCDKDTVPSTSGGGGTTSTTGPDPIVAVLQDGTCPAGYSKNENGVCKSKDVEGVSVIYATEQPKQDGTCRPLYHKSGDVCFYVSCKNFNQKLDLCQDYFSPPPSSSKPTSTLAPTQTGTTGMTTGTTTTPMNTGNIGTGGKTPAGSTPSQPECVPGFHWDNTQQKCV